MRLFLVSVFVIAAICAVAGGDILHAASCVVGGACVLSWPRRK